MRAGRFVAAELDVPLRTVALPQEFLEHGSRGDLLASVGQVVRVPESQLDAVTALSGSSTSARPKPAAPNGSSRASSSSVSENVSASFC